MYCSICAKTLRSEGCAQLPLISSVVNSFRMQTNINFWKDVSCFSLGSKFKFEIIKNKIFKLNSPIIFDQVGLIKSGSKNIVLLFIELCWSHYSSTIPRESISLVYHWIAIRKWNSISSAFARLYVMAIGRVIMLILLIWLHACPHHSLSTPSPKTSLICLSGI